MERPVLRDYQVPAVEANIDFLHSKLAKNPQLSIAPTAAGKSIIIAATASEMNERTLVFQPSVELLAQNFNKYLMYDQDVSIFSASANSKKLAKVTYATLGTAIKRPEIFKGFKNLIIDEAHLFSAQETGNLQKFRAANPQLKVLGTTATPFRLFRSATAGSKLVMLHNSHIYKGFRHIIQIQDIAPKFWSPIQYVCDHMPTSARLRVNSTGAEFTDASLELYGKTIEKQITEIISKNINKQGFIFVPSVDQARKLSKRDPDSGFICGTTPKPIRKKTLEDFKAGHIKRIYNFSVLSVGVDCPNLEYIIDGIPTLSLANHYQKVGRLTRPHPLGLHITKKYFDLAENTFRFGKMEDLQIRKLGTTYHVFSVDKQVTGVTLESLNLIRHNDESRSLPFLDMEIQFGRFVGQKISQVPEWWLSWCLDNITSNRKLNENIKIFLENETRRKNGIVIPGHKPGLQEIQF